MSLRSILPIAALVTVIGCSADPVAPNHLKPDLSFGGGTNSPPTVHITAPAYGQLFGFTSPAGALVNLVATIGDPDTGDTHLCLIDWNGATSTGLVVESSGSGTCTGSNTYATPGVYTIRATVTDPSGASATDSVMIVVYDPSSGFVTGGGWINAAPGSYPADPTLSGKSTFGLVAKYKNGATTPDGNTEFQFHAAGMNFHATSYDWLVVAGSKAQYKGVGTINGAGSYRFMMTLIDGQVSGGGGLDRLRMKIWDPSGVVFDNQMGVADGDDPATALAGGSIVIHK